MADEEVGEVGVTQNDAQKPQMVHKMMLKRSLAVLGTRSFCA